MQLCNTRRQAEITKHFCYEVLRFYDHSRWLRYQECSRFASIKKRMENREKLGFSNFYASVCSDAEETTRGLSEHVRFKREKSTSHGRSLHKNVEFRLHSALILFACLLNAAFVFSPRLALSFSVPLVSLFRSHSARACGVYNLCNDFHSVTIRRRRQIPRGALRDQTLFL